jgi:DNA invertase Pin-like site-specific DNA recombinase
VGAPFSLHSAAVNELELDPPLATGATVGYARVSTAGQLLDRQLASLTAAGCIRVFADKKSGKNIKREELWKALDFLRPGDTLVVASLDRLGRSLADLISIVAGLRRRGIGFASLHEAFDTTTPGGRLVFQAEQLTIKQATAQLPDDEYTTQMAAGRTLTVDDALMAALPILQSRQSTATR